MHCVLDKLLSIDFFFLTLLFINLLNPLVHIKATGRGSAVYPENPVVNNLLTLVHLLKLTVP